MSKNAKITIGLVVIAIVGVLVALNMSSGSDDSASDESLTSDRLMRPDSQKLSEGSTDVAFVEFLDFECEACGAIYPVIEDLRAQYGDRLTFVVRNFPLHDNSVAAAKAAEAAANQDKYEEMYSMIFETQAAWGEKSESQASVFFGYADEIGLDMDQFQADFDDPVIEERIERDRADGRALGVEGTPTFFLDGEKVEVTSVDDLIAQVAAAAGE